MTLIKLIDGDITNYKCDVIVNAANDKITHGDGLDDVIRNAAGPEMDKRTEAYRKEHYKKFPASQPVLTPGAVLAMPLWRSCGIKTCKWVYHAAAPNLQGKNGLPDASDEDSLTKSYLGCIKSAHEKKLKSIAFPLLGAGIFKYPLDHTFLLGIQVILAYFEMYPNHGIKEVAFIVHNNAPFFDRCKHLLLEQTSVDVRNPLAKRKEIIDHYWNGRLQRTRQIKLNTDTSAVISVFQKGTIQSTTPSSDFSSQVSSGSTSQNKQPGLLKKTINKPSPNTPKINYIVLEIGDENVVQIVQLLNANGLKRIQFLREIYQHPDAKAYVEDKLKRNACKGNCGAGSKMGKSTQRPERYGKQLERVEDPLEENEQNGHAQDQIVEHDEPEHMLPFKRTPKRKIRQSKDIKKETATPISNNSQNNSAPQQRFVGNGSQRDVRKEIQEKIKEEHTATTPIQESAEAQISSKTAEIKKEPHLPWQNTPTRRSIRSETQKVQSHVSCPTIETGQSIDHIHNDEEMQSDHDNQEMDSHYEPSDYDTDCHEFQSDDEIENDHDNQGMDLDLSDASHDDNVSTQDLEEPDQSIEIEIEESDESQNSDEETSEIDQSDDEHEDMGVDENSRIQPQNATSASNDTEKCMICGKKISVGKRISMNRSYSLLQHVKTHSDQKQFSCPSKGCGLWFTHLSNAKRHISSIHNTTDRPVDNKYRSLEMKRAWHEMFVKCFPTSEYNLKRRLNKPQTATGVEDTQECMVCLKDIKAGGNKGPLYNLIQHAKIHCEEKEFSCTKEGCHFASSRSNNVATHMKTTHDVNGKPKHTVTEKMLRSWTKIFNECFPNMQDKVNKHSFGKKHL